MCPKYGLQPWLRKMIQAPRLLANLPKPLIHDQSNVFGADVFSISGPRKRKRSELAVAIDGEGVNIYEAGSL